jgi:hypothetical protein
MIERQRCVTLRFHNGRHWLTQSITGYMIRVRPLRAHVNEVNSKVSLLAWADDAQLRSPKWVYTLLRGIYPVSVDSDLSIPWTRPRHPRPNHLVDVLSRVSSLSTRRPLGRQQDDLTTLTCLVSTHNNNKMSRLALIVSFLFMALTRSFGFARKLDGEWRC